MREVEARLLAHPEIGRLAEALEARPGAIAMPDRELREAAVALVLREGPGDQLEALMIKRAEAAGDPWSGHVALPGGRREPDDADLQRTAVRETWEETGVDIGRDGVVIGTLDDLWPRTPVLPAVLVRPFVAVVVPDVAIVPSFEVADAFWVPLAELRRADAWVEGTVEVRGESRTVTTFQHGAYTVWGMTERILRQFLTYLG
jgi:8-oxo-dGTP pyrophosphatase MutT (NUDIX family)